MAYFNTPNLPFKFPADKEKGMGNSGAIEDERKRGYNHSAEVRKNVRA